MVSNLNVGKNQNIITQLIGIRDALYSTALISETDLNGKIVYVNKIFEEVSKFTQEELLGKDHHILNSGEHPKKFFTEMWAALSTGETWRGEIKNKTKDGSYYWVDTTIFPKLDENKNTVGYISIRYDITERITHRLTLRKRRKETEVLNKLLLIDRSNNIPLNKNLEDALDIVFETPWLKLLNKGGVFLNENGVLTLKVSKKLGVEIENICAQVTKGTCLCGRAFEKKKTVHASCVNEEHENTFDGISPHGHYNVPIKHLGEVIGVVVYYLPHGHERDAEEVSFLESCAEVFSQIIVAYQNQKQLVQARDEAMAAEKSKTVFLANMSHEIRTPMNGILGMVQLIKDTELDAHQKDMLQTIYSCGESLMTILNDVLDLSKIESGNMTFETTNFNLSRCIEESIFLSNYRASQKGIELYFEKKHQNDFWFKGDVTRIRQVLVNLVSNAVKFTEKGSVIISIDYSDQVTVNVKDTGIGISKEQKKKLFHAFSQADASTTRKFGGTGLGLSICKRLIEGMGGEIFVESVPNQGSTFGFTLSLAQGQVEEERTPLTSNWSDDHDCIKILVAEDNSVNQKLAKFLFKKLKQNITIASTGQEALDQLKNNQFDIIFMDIQMPVMDGLKATKEIKRLYGNDHPPIIAMTANIFQEDRDQCFEVGMVDFIPKPIKLEHLKQALVKHTKTAQK